MRLRCSSGTCFGRLVVPLVCRTIATSSGVPRSKPGVLGLGVGRVERRGRRAEQGDREQQLDEVGAVGQRQRHPIAAPDPGRGQPAGQGLDPLGHLGVAEHLPVVRNDEGRVRRLTTAEQRVKSLGGCGSGSLGHRHSPHRRSVYCADRTSVCSSRRCWSALPALAGGPVRRPLRTVVDALFRLPVAVPPGLTGLVRWRSAAVRNPRGGPAPAGYRPGAGSAGRRGSRPGPGPVVLDRIRWPGSGRAAQSGGGGTATGPA
jgi:hypothetical protein